MDYKDFTKKLDSYFNKEDIMGAEKFLLESRENSRSCNDKKAELTVLNEMTGLYRQTGNKEEGVRAIDDCLELMRELNVENDINAGTIFLNCATTLKSFGMPERAMKLYEKSKVILEKLLDKNSPLLAGLYNNLALALQEIKNYDEAEKYFLSALEIDNRRDDCLLERAITLVNLGELYGEKDLTDERTGLNLEKAMEVLRNPMALKFPKYAYTCKRCAGTFGYFGYFMYEKELKERTECFLCGDLR